MNWCPLLGLVALAYAAFIIYVAATKKPDLIRNKGKLQGFVKVLGEKGTVIFFFISHLGFALLASGSLLYKRSATQQKTPSLC